MTGQDILADPAFVAYYTALCALNSVDPADTGGLLQSRILATLSALDDLILRSPTTTGDTT